MAQHLTRLSLAELISAFPLHLQFIRHALTHPQINPVVSINIIIILSVSKYHLTHSLCHVCQKWFISPLTHHIVPLLQVLLQLLSKVLSNSSLCEQGPWDIGNALLDICTIVMRTYHAETVFRGTSVEYQHKV